MPLRSADVIRKNGATDFDTRATTQFQHRCKIKQFGEIDINVIVKGKTIPIKSNGLKQFQFVQAPCISEFGIIKPISRGAFGKVYLAYKLTDKNKLYAVKVREMSLNRRHCVGQTKFM